MRRRRSGSTLACCCDESGPCTDETSLSPNSDARNAFFTGSSSAEQNAFEGFARSAEALKQQRSVYSLDDILTEVRRRDDSRGGIEPDDAIHVETRKRSSSVSFDAVGGIVRLRI